jgi:ABC-type Na+ efflux pump permease subunit
VTEIAVREFRTTVLTKAFLLAAIVLPAVFWVLALALPFLLQPSPKPLDGALAVVDADGRLSAAVKVEFDGDRLVRERERRLAEIQRRLQGMLPERMREMFDQQARGMFSSPSPTVRVESSADLAALEAYRQRVRSGELLACVRYESSVLGLEEPDNRFELFLREGLTRQQVDDLQGALGRAVVAARAASVGLDIAHARAVLAPPVPISTTLRADGVDVQENQLAKMFVPLAFMLLLWSSVWVTGNYLLTSTIEEKSSRVIEVLLSAVSPLELLAGKVIGQCAVGALMLGMYSGVGLSAASSLGYAHLVPPDKLVYLGVYFVMAFLMVAATMAAIGAAVSELRDAQTLLGPVTLLFTLPLFTWFFVTENPDSVFARTISYIPPMTPFAMVLRVASVESVPGWEIALTSLVGFGGVIAMVWAAARIFRIGILLTGKSATPAELWKWLRRP